MENITIDFSWQKNAACTDHEPDLFYLEHGKKTSAKVVALCKKCPVNNECLTHALKYEEYGYWAGTTHKKRVEIRRNLGITLVNIDYDSSLKVDAEIENNFANSLKIKGRGRKKAKCGTRSGYNAHLRRKKIDPEEVTCDACLRAQADSMAVFKQSQKEKRGKVESCD